MITNSVIVLIIAVGIVFCFPNDVITPCNKIDDACIEHSAEQALNKIFKGVPELNVEPSDPLDVGEVQGDLSTLQYTFTDTVTTGFLKCKVDYVRLDIEDSELRVNLTCPDIVIKGHYKIKGQLIVLPIEGEGPLRVDIKKYSIGMAADLKTIEGKDGKNHIIIKKYQLHGVPHDRIHYDLQNLFGGNKELVRESLHRLKVVGGESGKELISFLFHNVSYGDTVLKFANENWKEVADFVQGPLLDKIIKNIVINVNKFLKNIPIEDLYLA